MYPYIPIASAAIVPFVLIGKNNSAGRSNSEVNIPLMISAPLLPSFLEGSCINVLEIPYVIAERKPKKIALIS